MCCLRRDEEVRVDLNEYLNRGQVFLIHRLSQTVSDFQ